MKIFATRSAIWEVYFDGLEIKKISQISLDEFYYYKPAVRSWLLG